MVQGLMVATTFIDCNVIEFQVVVDTKEVATRFIACTVFVLPMVVATSVASGSFQFDCLSYGCP